MYVPNVHPVSVLFYNKYSEKSPYMKSHLNFLIRFGDSDSFGMRVFGIALYSSLSTSLLFFFCFSPFVSLPERASGLTSSAVLQ